MSELAEMATGERVRYYRERVGMTRPVLAGLCGRGPDWLKKIERGERPLRDHTLLVRLASALKLSDLSLLTGDPTPRPLTPGSRLVLPTVNEIRDAVRGPLFPPPAPAEPPSVDALRGRVAQAWRLWHTSRFQRTEVGALLPELLRDAQALPRQLEGVERRRAYAVLADVYHLTQQAAAYSVEPELYWIIADRGQQAAQEADDPLCLAGAAWTYGNGLRETGYAEEAIRAVEEAAEAIRPTLEHGADDLRGMYGALNLHAAITYAREGREGDAWRRWDEADRTAGRLPAGYAHAWTVFGRANTDIHGVSVGVDLRTPGAALSRAEDIDLDTVPSVERRSRVLIELARAQQQRKDLAGALHWMRKAVDTSPESVRYTPVARSLVHHLATEARGPLRADAQLLADEVGMAA
ncbi:helix-turn-helix domain-containing protein [Streptomyces gamaensis]|uniref:Helix-turn-helix domain-containing protein n=1 Tax=Streptomyces gamaensis TaxID=1763542 RepID=A0ABW0YTI6_9ACTN